MLYAASNTKFIHRHQHQYYVVVYSAALVVATQNKRIYTSAKASAYGSRVGWTPARTIVTSAIVVTDRLMTTMKVVALFKHSWTRQCYRQSIIIPNNTMPLFFVLLFLLWPPYVIGQAIIFSPCGFFLLSSFIFFSSPNLSGRRLAIYHTSTHGVALVRI